MARLILDDMISLGIDEENTLTHYQIALDSEFNNIVVDKELDGFHKEIIDPIILPDGSKYDGFTDIYARVKYIINGVDNGWHNLGLCNISKLQNFN